MVTSLSTNFHLSDDCFTVSGPMSGKKCIFPFMYRGVLYPHCTNAGNHDKLWCATETYQNGAYVSGQWGNCGLCNSGEGYLYGQIPNSQLSRCVARQLHAERHQGATYPKPRSPNSWSPSNGWMISSFSISCPIVPTCPIWALYLIPMA